MSAFYLEFRDPLFSIIIFFVLLFVISFFSYWWGRYKKREDHRHLDRFLSQFRSLPSKSELQTLISKGEISEKSWLLLARAYFKNGDYEKSIEIYNELLRIVDESHRRDILFLLGKTYFRAGFLQRAKELFLEILKYNPRTPQALNYLLLVYEYMRDYKSALEVLEPLDEMQKEVERDSIYLHLLALLSDSSKSEQEKARLLVLIYKKDAKFAHMIYEYLFRVDPRLAWENLDTSICERIVDILWSVEKKDLDLDIISQNGYLRELYTAQGCVSLAKSSTTFEFDVLIALQGRANATLTFEYICESCKQSYPFAFNRCTHCHSLDSMQVTLGLTKHYYRNFCEENNSFQ
ncbi:MAG: tetratricopeptide repeat protein [Epsilonproteobacteria bacterium]|nr:tetratricopeptide repeat protein [Campylobacterota bacterium]